MTLENFKSTCKLGGAVVVFLSLAVSDYLAISLIFIHNYSMGSLDMEGMQRNPVSEGMERAEIFLGSQRLM